MWRRIKWVYGKSVLPSRFKSRLLAGFAVIWMLMLLMSATVYFHTKNSARLMERRNEVRTLQLSMYDLFYDDARFVDNNHLNRYFYKTGQSAYLDSRKEQSFIVSNALKRLRENSILTAVKHWTNIETTFETYNAVFSEITRKQLARGFKDYGKEGQMRRYIHQLLDGSSYIDKSDLLMLRRHEKDFFLRSETDYVDMLNALVWNIESEHVDDPSPMVRSELDLLRNYRRSFNDVAVLDTTIGIANQSGLKRKLDMNRDKIEAALGAYSSKMLKSIDAEQSKIHHTLSVVIIAGLITTIVLIYWLVQTLSRPLEELAARFERQSLPKRSFRVPYRKMPREIQAVVRSSNKQTHIRSFSFKHLTINA